jgi:hypothetical protein
MKDLYKDHFNLENRKKGKYCRKNNVGKLEYQDFVNLLDLFEILLV